MELLFIKKLLSSDIGRFEAMEKRTWADEARILPGKWESVVDSQGVKDTEDARNRALGELQNASMEWQRAEVRCEGLYQAHPGMRVTLKYVGERFSASFACKTR